MSRKTEIDGAKAYDAKEAPTGGFEPAAWDGRDWRTSTRRCAASPTTWSPFHISAPNSSINTASSQAGQ